MQQMRIAVIGAGISGLVSAYVLAKAGVDVVLYEKEASLGGHAKTVTVDDGIDLDLGFMVFNRVTYPNMMEFFESLGVDMEVSDMLCRYVEDLENNPYIERNETLGQFISSHGYSDLFQKAYLV
ncbi:hypothetical protein POM88_047079 [Heracleum sosnowskyi]|uniref:FAD-dependent oxidoreductase n=1 Tax=Heracleum sosnowskyi TaxID=360622 RepID=A0AAD8HAQ0_9APIA|nr:hypothetical protein POM88_047078 [Heracleum sosnowskyi]KAK1362605.1 hypothetical protein POM88_047079 [Heracleum sosnowskyi]